MKRLLAMLLAAAGMTSLPAAVSATAITFTDTVGPGLHICLSAASPAACSGGGASGPSHSFTLDITDSGFIPDSPISAAEITIGLGDDRGGGDGSEKLDLLLDGTPVVNHGDANHDVTLDLSSLTALLADGKLVVTVSAHTGDFFLEGATLTVHDDPLVIPGQVAIPAPAALILVAAGVVGLAAIVRKRFGDF